MSRTQSLFDASIIWDNHACLPMRLDDTFLPELSRFRTAGVTVVSVNVGFGEMDWKEHIDLLSYMRRWISQRPEEFMLVAQVEDVLDCKRSGRLGIVFDVEGMYPVQDSPARVRILYALGVRWMLVAYNRNNAAGGGCLDEDTGLSDIGRKIIDEMERVGMVVCLSHTGEKTALDVLDYAKKPVVFSHSNSSAVAAHPRNISDRLILACAKAGGIIGLNGFGPFLGARSELVEIIIRHIEHICGLVGAEHVGLGLDYVFDKQENLDHIRAHPQLYPPGILEGYGMIEPENIFDIAEGLAKYNYADDQIQGIMGANWLRLVSDLWKPLSEA